VYQCRKSATKILTFLRRVSHQIEEVFITAYEIRRSHVNSKIEVFLILRVTGVGEMLPHLRTQRGFVCHAAQKRLYTFIRKRLLTGVLPSKAKTRKKRGATIW